MLRIGSLTFILCYIPIASAEAILLPLPEMPTDVGVSAERYREVLNEKSELEIRLQDKEQRIKALEAELGNMKRFPVPDMVRISGGCFKMGQNEQEKQWLIALGGESDNNKYFSDEKGDRVCVEDFWLAKAEVSVAEFRRFVQSTGYISDAEKSEGCNVWRHGKWESKANLSWRDPGFIQTDAHPVVCVTWNDAQRYINWLGQETRQQFRLPTEAQWEFAARAKSDHFRYWGNDKGSKEACRYANVADETSKKIYRWSPIFVCNDGYAETAPVGVFTANDYGLKDMLGNVSEWTCSAYESTYGNTETKCADENDSRPRVFRGGSWSSRPRFVRSANRYRDDSTQRYSVVGFRLSRTR